MHPILFKLGPITIYSYGTMIALSFLTYLFLLKRESKKCGISYQMILDGSFWVLIFSIIGARIFYIIAHLDYFKIFPQEIFKLYHGGLVLYGGVIFGVLTGIIYLTRKKQNIAQILDIIAPYIALSQAIGRIGCLLNGCCAGYISSRGLYFPVYKEILVPMQFYASLINLAIFITLRLTQNKISTQGNIFILYLMFYSTKRFITEFFRADSMRSLWGLSIFQILSVGQVISLLIFIISAVIFIIRIRCKNSNLL